jgi:two-component system sensor histidine kinase BarA
VRDQPVPHHSLLTTFAHLGHHADVAMTGHETITACCTQAYDLVVLDVALRELANTAVAMQIRQLPLKFQPYIVVLTDAHALPDMAWLQQCGVNASIVRPVQPAELTTILHAAAQRAAEHPAPQPATDRMPADTPVPHSAALPSLDREVLHELYRAVGGDDLDTPTMFVTLYLDDIAGHLASARAGLAHNDWFTVKRAGHSIGSLAAQIGAHRLAAYGRALEAQASIATGHAVPNDLLHQMDTELANVRDAIALSSPPDTAAQETPE